MNLCFIDDIYQSIYVDIDLYFINGIILVIYYYVNFNYYYN